MSAQRQWLMRFLAMTSVSAIASAAPSTTTPSDSKVEQTRATVSAKCQEMAKLLGLSASTLADTVQRASPVELVNLMKTCDSAYPSRSLDQAAVVRGRTVYTTYGCSVCHGIDARGGESGPSLVRSQRVMRDKSGEKIGEVVLKGVPNTRMVAFPLKSGELPDLAQFLHSLQAGSDDSATYHNNSIVTGNAEIGKRYFDKKCSGCHSVSTDVDGLGARYQDPRVLQQTWLMPKNASPISGAVRASGGAAVTGTVLRSDEFLITLRLADGTVRSFNRADSSLQFKSHDALAGHKALLPVYTDRDIHNVTAYLVSLIQSRRFIETADANAGQLEYATSKHPTATARPAATPGLPSDAIRKYLGHSWPTYAGDYSARRYSSLAQIDQSNITDLALSWTARVTAGPDDAGPHPVIVAGEGKGDLFTSEPARICGSILAVNNILYLSSADNAWAINAHDGSTLWHFNWKTRGGWRFCNRGIGMWGNNLYFETPDAYLVSLDARTGHERWHVEIASFDEQYFASTPPVIVDHHVLVGVGNTLNSPGFLQSFDPETGKLQWRRYSVPMNAGDSGLQTWKNLDAARHGGGQVWMPGAYDPDTRLYIYGTGNPTPTYSAELRGNGDALFTCSVLAVDVDTGELAWYYQTSPNDTHDWDSTQTPILADLDIKGKRRKVAMTAARNGYFFVVDRVTGEHLITSKFSHTVNWAEPQLNAKGQPVRIAAKDSHISGALVSNANDGAVNWQPASYSPDYQLFYAPVAESWAVYYKTEVGAGDIYSMVGKDELPVDADSYLKAIDPQTGRIVWSVKYPSRGPLASGVLTTAGRLLFSGDTAENLVARNPANGQPLWHVRLGMISNAPQTYMIDGRQYILVAVTDTLYAFKLPN